MKKYYPQSLLILFFLLGLCSAACNPNPDVQIVPNAPTAQRTMHIQPTGTMISPTYSSTSCWPIRENTESVKGSFIYLDRSNQRAFAWDLSSFHTQPIRPFPEGLLETFTFSVSPDGNTIIGVSSGNNKITFISPDKIQSIQLPGGNYRYSYVEYLSDGRIRIPVAKGNLKDNYHEGTGFTDEYIIFDPATGELTAHSVFLPNFSQGWHGTYPIEYSPNMHYVVYLTGYDHEVPRYTLFDLLKNQIVWSGPESLPGITADSARMPIWRPDSSALTYSFFTGEEKYGNYYSISLDGKLAKLTSFERTRMFGINMGFLANPSWSPDGRYLAFKAVLGTTGPFRLYIWDDQAKVAYMPCLPDEDQIDPGYIGDWFYDGSNYLITLSYPNKDLSEGAPLYVRHNPVILDLTSKTIMELPDQDHRGEYTSLYGNGQNELLGWVKWEVP